MNEVNLAPGLLVSMPQLNDPFFGRSVVLMVEHNDDGSFGLILNQASRLPVSHLLSVLDMEWDHGDAQNVFSGDPVLPESGWVLHSPIGALAASSDGLEDALGRGETISILPTLCLSSSMTSLRAIIAEPTVRTKFILGYSGWAAGQLAQEMARGSWLHADITSELVFDTPTDQLWKSALTTIGVDPEAIIQTSGIH